MTINFRHNMDWWNSFFRYLIPLALATIGVLILYVWTDNRRQVELLMSRKVSENLLIQQRINRELSQVVGDLRTITTLPDVLSWLDDPSSSNEERLVRAFSAFSQWHKNYDHVRFINLKGMEQIRINLLNGDTKALPKSKLQYKGDRDFFKDAVDLNNGELFVSELTLNLNREPGEEIKPTIRFSIPVADSRGVKKGVLVINMIAEEMLSWLDQGLDQKDHAHTDLLNGQGYWLHTEDPKKEWAFMYGKDEGFARSYQKEWSRIGREESGQFRSPDGLITFHTIRMPGKGPSERPNLWKLVSRVTHQELDRYTVFYRPGIWIVMTSLFALMVVVSIGLANARERKRQTDVLIRESEEKFLKAFENAPTMISISDMETSKYIAVNKEKLRISGFSREEVLDHTSVEIGWITEDQRSQILKAIEKEGRMSNVEMVLHGKGGRVINGLFSGERLSIGGRNCLLTATVDITDRKVAERELMASERKFRDHLDNIQLLGVMLDHEGCVTFCNDFLMKLTGWSREEVLNGNWFDLFIPDEQRENVRSLFLANIGEGNLVSHYENQILTRTGELRKVVWDNTVLRDGSGVVIGTAGIGVDVTDHRRIEESLRRAEKMEALGTLAGGVAHDLNNTLGVTMSYAELLQEDAEEGSHARKYADRIFSSTEKAAATVQDLLTLARRGVSVSEVMNLTETVALLLKSPEYERLSQEHPLVIFRADLENNLLNIKGSPVHIEKTVLNLLSNAAESIPGAGEVTIRTESRYVEKPIRGYDEVKAGEYAVLKVSDSGKGIDPQDLGRIFEPFYTKKKMGRSGTGLGLAIVWGAVKDHKGYIDVESREGLGTTFSIYIPVTREERPKGSERLSRDQYMGNGETILVVDDDAGQRQIAEAILRRLNYRVVTFPSGEAAVAYLKENRANLVVLDMIMEPGMDGLDTYRQMISIYPRQKAIIVSGFSETDRVKEAERLGVGAYIKKPYSREKMGVALREELERA